MATFIAGFVVMLLATVCLAIGLVPRRRSGAIGCGDADRAADACEGCGLPAERR